MVYITVYGTDTDVWVGNHDAFEAFARDVRMAARAAPAPDHDPVELLLDPEDDWVEDFEAEQIGLRLAALRERVRPARRAEIDKAIAACRRAFEEARPLRFW